MAICNYCGDEMLTADDCAWNRSVEYNDGTMLPSVRYKPEIPTDRCGDCGVAPGKFHHVGCDMELCPKCLTQLISCNCGVKESELELNAPLAAAADPPAEENSVTYQIDEPEAKGEIKIERGGYGLYIHINGKCLAMVDLFYFSDEWKSQVHVEKPEDKTDFPQLVIYSGNEADDPFATVQWFQNRVVIWSDHPSATTKIENGTCAAIQTVTVTKESEDETNG